jgi:hypothetical protein
MKKSSFLFCLVTISLSTSLSGCVILAPFIQAWKNVGATESDRMTLLNARLKKFGEALYWGKGEAALFVGRDAAEGVNKGLRIDREDVRIVETKIKDIQYLDSAFTAQVEFSLRYYRIPFYVVTDAKEKHVWKFRLGGDWELVEREVDTEFLGK